MTTKRRFSRPWAQLVVVLGLAMLTPATSRAQAHGSYDESVQQAVLEYNAGNFEEAQALFRRAHSMEPNARTWRGLGICAFELRLYVEATADLETALSDTRKPLTPQQRTETKRLLEEARAFVSSYRLHTVPEDAHVLVDGKPAPLHDHTLRLDPGHHLVVVTAPGYAEQRTELRTGAGIREDLRIELALVNAPKKEQPAVATAPPPPVVLSAQQQQPARHRRVWTWALAASAVASSAVAVGLRLRVNALHREFTDCSNHNGSCQAIKQQGQNVVFGSRVVGGIAGGLALGMLVALIVERDGGASDKTTTLLLGPQGLELRGRF